MTVYRQLQVMVTGKKGRPLRAKLLMAERVFKCDVLRIVLSDFDKRQDLLSLGVKVSCCASGMYVVIMGAEHSRRKGQVR